MPVAIWAEAVDMASRERQREPAWGPTQSYIRVITMIEVWNGIKAERLDIFFVLTRPM